MICCARCARLKEGSDAAAAEDGLQTGEHPISLHRIISNCVASQ